MGWNNDGGWAPYVSVAQRRANADKAIKTLKKKGRVCVPVVIDTRAIATTFWGKQWCDNLEQYSDYENRLPRGRTYARNGSVVDLQIGTESITALVSGSSLYEVKVTVRPLEPDLWQAILARCAGQVASLVELLQGRLSAAVMAVVAQAGSGLFPAPRQIRFTCSCPDGANMCKHIAAALYGVGHRLDQQPELLFLLRNIDPAQLIQGAVQGTLVQAETDPGQNLADADLSALFGIDLDVAAVSIASPAPVKTISAGELTARGVPVHMRQCWLKSGVLLASGQRAVYALADHSEQAIADYLARRAKNLA
ncbi:MAG: SWIM zinc finger family protein [Pseudomonadota bacterium]